MKPGPLVRLVEQDKQLHSDEPVFIGFSQTAPKQRRLRQVFSDVDLTESDIDNKSRKKKRSESDTCHKNNTTGPESKAE